MFKKKTRAEYPEQSYSELLQYLPIDKEWRDYEKKKSDREKLLLTLPSKIQNDLNRLPCDFFRKLQVRQFYRAQIAGLMDKISLIPGVLDAINCYQKAIKQIDESIWFSILMNREINKNKPENNAASAG